jgi:hypothetical protein
VSEGHSSRPVLAVVSLTVVAALLRTYSTYNGGIWADEGLVFNIVAIPTWREMFAFLSAHESHPPLFYSIIRAWQAMVGSSDVSTLAIIAVFGTAIVPVTYLVTRSLFSKRTALVSAALVAVSPSLIQHSAQLRPYGLLPILVLISSWALTRAIEGFGLRHWIIYALATTSMLYTHHWTWLVWAGQVAALTVILFRSPALQRVIHIRRFALASLMILALYSWWWPSFLFQVAHAGHSAPSLPNPASYASFLILGVGSLPSMLFVGDQRLSRTLLAIVLIAIVAALTVEILRSKSSDARIESPDGGADRRRMTLAIFLITPTVSITACLILSFRSYMMLDRCLVMLTPLLLIAAASWLSRTAERGRAGLLAFILVLSLGGAIEIIRQPRANTREVAALIQSKVSSGDLLIVSPQWRAPAFNHYFPAGVEQIDFPHQGRSLLLDFTGLRERPRHLAELRLVIDRIGDAKAKKRRVWLVTARQYLTKSPTSEISRVLNATYGNADTTLFERRRSARYEELLPFLFTTSK